MIAILNDTTGTLLQGRFVDKDCAIGMIVGSGGNICYLEKVSTVSKLADQTHLETFGGRTSGDCDKHTQMSHCNGGGICPASSNTIDSDAEVAIDIECGAFGDDGKINFIHTKYDETVDKNSLFTNSFTLVYYRPITLSIYLYTQSTGLSQMQRFFYNFSFHHRHVAHSDSE